MSMKIISCSYPGKDFYSSLEAFFEPLLVVEGFFGDAKFLSVYDDSSLIMSSGLIDEALRTR